MFKICGLFPQLLLLVGAVNSAGCVRNGSYDLSSRRPFEAYVGKDVVIQRDVVLVRDYPVTVIGYPDEATLQKVDKSQHPAVLLRRGTAVHVQRTFFSFTQQTPLQACFRNERIISEVTIKLSESSWPSEVTAQFDHSAHQSSSFGYGSFKGAVRPAPWEPTDTPAIREMTVRNGHDS
jgi:hypothetical protein